MDIESDAATAADRRALSRKWIDRRAWDNPRVRSALAERDLATVYRVLRAYGVSQRRIAAITGQAQSEISEILAGRRVTSYDVLAHICEGFGLPRGWMGLAVDQDAQLSEEEPRCRCGCSCGQRDGADWPTDDTRLGSTGDPRSC